MSKSTSPRRRKHSKLHTTSEPRIKACPETRKGCYRSRKRALTALNHLKAKGDPVTEVYKCRFCGEWHLTSRVY